MDRILKNVPLGEEISIVSVNMYQQWKHGGSYPNDVLYIVYKDKHGNKSLVTIPKPKQEIFFTKPEYRHLWSLTRDSVKRDMVFPVEVPPQKIVSAIHDQLKDEDTPYSQYYRDLYKQSYDTNNSRMRKELHKYPHVFMSDLSITDSYILNLCTQYNTKGVHKVKKSFMDIETDIYGLSDADTKIFNKDKINAITFVTSFDPFNKEENSDKKHVFTFLLRDYSIYTQQEEFEKDIESFKVECKERFNNIPLTVNGKEIMHKSDFEFHFLFFDSEGDLLTNFYSIVNAVTPDTMAIWNIEFDIPKIYNRMIMNGIDPIQAMSHPQYPKEARFLEMNIDRRGFVTFSNRKTNIKSSNLFLHVDQMLLYAGMTKGAKSIPDYSLDTVLGIEIGYQKDKFENGITIRNVHRKDYKKFVLYSINDTISQEVLDFYTSHTNTAFKDTQTAGCPLEYTTKPTMYTRNYYHLCKIRDFGMIPGNNPNTDYLEGMDAERYDILEEIKEAMAQKKADEEDEMDFADEIEKEMYDSLNKGMEDGIDVKHPLGGGVVGDPHLNINNGEEIIKGFRSKHIFKNVIDYDYASEYPWIKYTRNLGKETEIGRLIFDKRLSPRQNEYQNDIYLPGAEFISDYISQDWLSMGVVYFNLPSSTELIKKARAMSNAK